MVFRDIELEAADVPADVDLEFADVTGLDDSDLETDDHESAHWEVRSAVVSEPQLRQLLAEMPVSCQQCQSQVLADVKRLVQFRDAFTPPPPPPFSTPMCLSRYWYMTFVKFVCYNQILIHTLPPLSLLGFSSYTQLSNKIRMYCLHQNHENPSFSTQPAPAPTHSEQSRIHAPWPPCLTQSRHGPPGQLITAAATRR